MSIPSFLQIVHDVYATYHTKKSLHSHTKIYRQLAQMYDVLYCDEWDNPLFVMVGVAKELLECCGLLSEHAGGRKIQDFNIELFKNHTNYVLFLFREIERCVVLDYENDKQTLIETLNKEYQKLIQFICKNNPDPFLSILHKDLIDLINYRPANTVYNPSIQNQLLNKLKSLTPTQFEHFALHLIASISKEEYDDNQKLIIHNGQVGDGGIDGIVQIKNRLGRYDDYFIQCKRYDKTAIGRPEMQGFVGSMMGRQAIKGIFVTTSTFTQTALDYLNDVKVCTIETMDGNQLVEYMLTHKIGITETVVYMIDDGFFNGFPDS